MLVHFLTDEPTKIPAIRAMLGPQHDVEPQVLGVGGTPIISNGVLMVDADLRKADPVEQIRRVLQEERTFRKAVCRPATRHHLDCAGLCAWRDVGGFASKRNHSSSRRSKSAAKTTQTGAVTVSPEISG